MTRIPRQRSAAGHREIGRAEKPATARPAVLVLMGGPDAEREVSLASGRAVAQALRESGRYRVLEHVVERPTEAELAVPGADVVFPALHGPFGEGGPLQALLESVGLPYVGFGPQAAALAMDKLAAKDLVAAAGVPTPPACRLEAGDPCPLAPPVVLKPLDDGSSVDLFICRDEAAVASARATLHARRGPVMAERYVAGREVTVGIVAGEALPLIEVIPAVEFYDYEAKYLREDTQYVTDPPLPEAVAEACKRTALLAFRLIGGRDLARVDFIADRQGPWFLEINAMPGFTSHSLVPMAARRRGLDLAGLCARLVEQALARSPAARAGG